MDDDWIETERLRTQTVRFGEQGQIYTQRVTDIHALTDSDTYREESCSEDLMERISDFNRNFDVQMEH